MATLVDRREQAEKGLASLRTPADRFAWWLSQFSSPLVVTAGYLISGAAGAYIDEGQLSMGTIRNGVGLTLDTPMGVC